VSYDIDNNILRQCKLSDNTTMVYIDDEESINTMIDADTIDAPTKFTDFIQKDANPRMLKIKDITN